jgi:uncharacterized protein (DUF4415 family)
VAFKAATTKPAELPPKLKVIKNVPVNSQRDKLLGEAGPGWQDRINEALRKVVGK